MTEIPDNSRHDLAREHPSLAQPDPGAAAAPESGAQPGPGLAEHGLRTRAGEPALAASATRSLDDATRSFETAQGRLSYSELAERLAGPLLAIDLRLRQGAYAQHTLDEALLLSLHAELSAIDATIAPTKSASDTRPPSSAMNRYVLTMSIMPSPPRRSWITDKL